MKGIPDFTPSGALRDGATSCPYHSTRVPGYPRPERATGSQRGGYGVRERKREREREKEEARGRGGESQEGKNEKSKPTGLCLVEQKLLYICSVYMCVHVCGDLEPSHLTESRKVRLFCLLSPHIHTLTHLRGRDEPGLQKCQKNSDLSILEIALNLAISWITTTQAQLATTL